MSLCAVLPRSGASSLDTPPHDASFPGHLAFSQFPLFRPPLPRVQSSHPQERNALKANVLVMKQSSIPTVLSSHLSLSPQKSDVGTSIEELLRNCGEAIYRYCMQGCLTSTYKKSALYISIRAWACSYPGGGVSSPPRAGRILKIFKSALDLSNGSTTLPYRCAAAVCKDVTHSAPTRRALVSAFTLTSGPTIPTPLFTRASSKAVL